MARYEEVADDLRRRIRGGEYPVGTTLPGYAELTQAYSVGRGVIASALQLLEREGLVRVAKRSGIRVLDWTVERRRIKRGRLVTRDPARGYIFPAASHPNEPWRAHGRPTRSYERTPERVAELAGVAPGTALLRRRRIMSPAGEPPFSITDTWLTPDAVRDAPQAGEIDTGPGGYIDRLEEAGHGPLTWTEYARARPITREEAGLLDVSHETVVQEIALVATSAETGHPVEVTTRIIPADRVEIVTDLQRDQSAQWPVTPVQRTVTDS